MSQTKKGTEGEKVTRLRTKAQILKGRDAKVVQRIELLDAEVELRPLTDGQATEVEVLEMKGQQVTPDSVGALGEDGKVDNVKLLQSMRLDVSALGEWQAEADALAVSYSLVLSSGGPLSVEDVKGMRPPGVVAEIAEHVRRISGLGKEGAAQARDFRPDA